MKHRWSGQLHSQSGQKQEHPIMLMSIGILLSTASSIPGAGFIHLRCTLHVEDDQKMLAHYSHVQNVSLHMYTC